MIDLYMWGTAHGLRASLALAATGLAHRIVKVDLAKGEHKTPEFLKLNPVGAIPVMVDHAGPGGRPLTLAQSGAIVVYACEKAAKFIPVDGVRRAMAAQWYMAAASDIACASGSIFYSEAYLPDKSAANTGFFRNRLINYFRQVDRHLAGRDFLADEFSFADLTMYPNYTLRKAMLEEAGGMEQLRRWGERVAAQPGVAKGMNP